MAVDTARARSKLLGLSLPRRGGPATNESTGLLFTLPIIFLFVAFNLLPTVYAFVVSLTTYNLFTPPTFVGFENYLDLLGNRNFWQAVGVTVGYTLLFGTIGTNGIGPALYKNLSFDPVKDLAPVSSLHTLPNVLLVNAAVPARTVAELIALAKARPAQLTFASAGSGSASTRC